ncbi:MAG TPA: hypothetical protein VGQ83_20815 [Polyangia bacterium]|jgi:hypothetical protein
MRPFTLALCALCAAACGTIPDEETPDAATPDGAPLGGLVALTVEPADARLEIINTTPAQQRYLARGHFGDGTARDVTAQVAFSLDDASLGGFDGASFTSKLTAGSTTVRARNGAVEGTTTVTLVQITAVFTDGVPANAPALLGGAAPGGPAPAIVYPPDGVLIPPNLTLLDVQFRPGAGQDLFEVRFRGETTELRIYAGCTAVGGGCSVIPDPDTWHLISAVNAGRAPFTLEVRALDTAHPQQSGLSAPVAVGIAQQEVLGGIYYWNAKVGEIDRYDFGLPTPQGEKYYTAGEAHGSCVGCHVLSPKGTRIAVGLDAPTQVSALRVLDTGTKAQLFSLGQPLIGGGSNFQAFSPDDSEIITSNGGTLVLRDAATGVPKDPNPLASLGTMADYAPDGSMIVYSRPVANPCMVGNMCLPGINKGSLMLKPRYADGTWGDATTLVQQTGTENNYYPAFSPDGVWILYNFSPGQMSYDAPDADLRVVSLLGGAVLELTAANLGGGNSWPKWGPFIQEHRGGKIMWLTFSSRRAYGERLGAGQTAQIWMAAFDPDQALAGLDPSYPAFWLPFQDPTTGNHIAQWVPSIARQPCTDASECGPGEMCQDNQCVPNIQ